MFSESEVEMEIVECSVCCSTKTALTCNTCNMGSCKKCAYFIDESEYEFLALFNEKPDGEIYCPNCYNDNIEPVLDKYNEILDLAKDVNAYVGNSDLRARAIRRIEKPVKIEDCLSREDALMRLGFLVAQKGFDTMVDVSIVSKKVGGAKRYKKLVWSGTAVPVDPKIRKY